MKICRTAGTNDEPPVQEDAADGARLVAGHSHEPIDLVRHECAEGHQGAGRVSSQALPRRRS